MTRTTTKARKGAKTATSAMAAAAAAGAPCARAVTEGGVRSRPMGVIDIPLSRLKAPPRNALLGWARPRAFLPLATDDC
jgi:hypothetical protein